MNLKNEKYTEGPYEGKYKVVYYNNAATEEIISLYLQQPVNKKKTRLDYLFVSESATGNKPVATVRELEANDLFDTQIEQIKKAIKNNEKNKSSLLNKYIENKLTDEEYNLAKRMIEEEHNELVSELNRVTNDKENYISPTPKADRIYIQKPITHTAGEDIIKDTLKKIGINAKNRKNKDDEQTTKSKYNTHSLRKTFADEFIKTGERLDSNSDLHFSNTILELLKDKFKHSSKSVTTHYTNAQEEAFKIICQNLNIGLESIRNFV